jgi:hypothetical protein
MLLGGMLAWPSAVLGERIDAPPPLPCASQTPVPANVVITDSFLRRRVQRGRLYETDRATAFGQVVEDDFHRHKRGDACVAD